MSESIKIKYGNTELVITGKELVVSVQEKEKPEVDFSLKIDGKKLEVVTKNIEGKQVEYKDSIGCGYSYNPIENVTNLPYVHQGGFLVTQANTNQPTRCNTCKHKEQIELQRKKGRAMYE